MHLSMTYMTDVFFISILIFALNALVNYNSNANFRSYLWFCFWCVIAMLCRQQALIFGLLIAPGVLKQHKKFLLKLVLVALPVFLCWLASDKYRHHLVANHIGHNIQQMHHLKDYLKDAPIDNHILQFADGLLVLGGFVFPISMFLFLQFIKQVNRKDLIILAITTIATLVFTIKAFGIYPIGNISEMFEIGPRAIKSGGEIITGEWAKKLHILNYVLAAVSLNLMLFFTLKKAKENTVLFTNRTAKIIYFLVALIYLLFVAVSKAYFDRYVLPLFLLVLLLAVPNNADIKRTTKIITVSVLFLIYASSLIQNLDYFNWQKKRAEAINYLYSKGANHNEIDGGFEFNGWVKKNNIYPSDPTKSWWWVVDDKYMVSAKAINGTSVDTAFIYQHYIPFQKDTVFVLSRK